MYRSLPILSLIAALIVLPTNAAGQPPAPEEPQAVSLTERIDGVFAIGVHALDAVLFWSPVEVVQTQDGERLRVLGLPSDLVPVDSATGAPAAQGVPLVVLVLLLGALGFTLYNRFINVRAFGHSLRVIRGDYDNPSDKGEISHFQALTSALSATVGLGNIAGVAIAVGTGGPGAVFWMLLAASLGMTSKFVECSLAQFYRRFDPDGTVHGGPMYYISIGLRERGWPTLGRITALVFAVFCIGGSLGGGNMFQANQAGQQIADEIPFLGSGLGPHMVGIGLALLVGMVIIGGIRRIGEVTSKVVPFMCAGYVLAGLYIVFANIGQVPSVVATIFSEAFSFDAGFGGFLGIMVTGIRRAVFSNEAGVGSAAIAHSAARTEWPIREGVVASIGPFIDTILICLMTAMVVIVTGAHESPDAGSGVSMTSWAFASVFPWFPKLLTVAVVLFAYSTMISWSYYGEKATAYLFGHGRGVQLAYRVLFLFFVYLGAVTSLDNVLDFSDLMILSMAFPNIVGMLILAPMVLRRSDEYMAKLRAGEFKVYR
ncbi:MAG: alanine glycine permease [Gemmatimonadetes bacterium]|nr:alanine glycine permease [Gemmatimonadota bacterium]